MKTTRYMYWGAQLIGWIVYAMLLVFATYAQNPKDLTVLHYIKLSGLLVLAITLTHLMRNIFIKYGWLDIKLPTLLPRVIGISLLVSIVFAFVYEGFCYLIEIKTDNYKETTFLNFYLEIFSVLILILFWNALYFTYHFFMKSRQQEMSNIKLEANRNAIKHGISKLINGGEIQIKIGQTEDKVFFIVENTGTLGSDKDLGIGIENTKRRLALQYKGKAHFSIYQEGDSVISSINFSKK